MAATGTPTPNIGLRIPQGTDPASVDDINYNSNLLDTKLGAVGNTSVQDQIDSLNSKSTGTISKTISDGTLTDTTCTKVGNTVFASGRIHTISPSVTANGQFFQLPEGFRPVSSFRGIGYISVDSVGFVPVFSTISTNGSVSLNYSSSATANQVYFFAVFSVM